MAQELKIVTENICPPVPKRMFDWVAHYDGEEEFGPYGYGSTEAEAIANLKKQTEITGEERYLVRSKGS